MIALFLGIYLLSHRLDKWQPSRDEDALVSDGSWKGVKTSSFVASILLFVLILPRLGFSFGGVLEIMLDFLKLVRSLLPF